MLLLLFAVAAATFVYYYMCNRKLYGDLPGPSPLLSAPFVGHAYLLGADPAKKLMEYRSEHGDLFRFDVGGDPTVLLCNHDMATEALRREEFSGRPFNRVPTVNAIQPIGHKGQFVHGVVVSEGAEWQEQRKFMLKNLSAQSGALVCPKGVVEGCGMETLKIPTSVT